MFQAASLENLFPGPQLLQRTERRLSHVGGILGSQRFGENVFDTGRFHNGTDGFSTDQAGTRTGRTQQNLSATEMGINFMRDGILLGCDTGHRGLGVFPTLFNGIADFGTLTQADSHPTTAITGDDERAEAETSTTFDNLGGTVNKNHFLYEIVARIGMIVVTTAMTATTATTTIPTVMAVTTPICRGGSRSGSCRRCCLFFFVSHSFVSLRDR